MVIVAIVLFALAAVVVLLAVGAYNRLVRLRNLAEEAWAGIAVQLTRRHDLSPNLVETVKGYAAHEREAFQNVTEARARAIGAQGVAEQAQAENVLTGALKSLFAGAQAYPELKANENFLALQEELTGTEVRIAYARQFYNDTVLRYNTKIQSVAANLVAGPFNFREREYFEADDTSRGPVTVQF